jgi:biopolymer transport protein ExbB
MNREAVLAWLDGLWLEAESIWIAGGWAMAPIAAIAAAMFALGVHVYLKLRETGFESVPERTWRIWINTPHERKGPIGELLEFVSGARSVADASVSFEQMRVAENAAFERDLRVMKICVSAAPLFGLLGTVTGMLATFDALATGSGGEKTMGLIAKGISEALITTETGLVVALPGLFFQYQLSRKHERYKAFLAHVESVFTQKLFHKLSKPPAATVQAV